MSSRPLLGAALCGVVMGCGPSQAPKEIDALSSYLYQHCGDADPMALHDGLANLAALLAPVNLTSGSTNDRAWQVTPPTAAEVAGLTWPAGHNPSDMLGSAVARASQWPVTDHARLQIAPDQLPIEPSATAYARKFVNPTDASCFADERCLEMDTDNDLTRASAVLSISFSNHKDFKWVKYGDAAAPLSAIVARTWIDREFKGEKGTIHETAALDIWMGRSDGSTWRYQVNWTDTEISIVVDTSLQLAVVDSATDEGMRAADTVIGQRFHAM